MMTQATQGAKVGDVGHFITVRGDIFTARIASVGTDGTAKFRSSSGEISGPKKASKFGDATKCTWHLAGRCRDVACDRATVY